MSGVGIEWEPALEMTNKNNISDVSNVIMSHDESLWLMKFEKKA